jgi:Sec-independent protein secretion pathway component TatC
MSIGDHLEDLRRRVMLSIIPPLPLAIILFLFGDTIVNFLLRPLYSVLEYHGLPPQVQLLSPPELLLTQMKLSVILAIIISGPWILWQVWQFIAPGLYRHERRFVHILFPGSGLLLAAGLSLMYWVMLPLILHVMVVIGMGLQGDPVMAPSPGETTAVTTESHGIVLPLLEEMPAAPVAGEAWINTPRQTLQVAIPADDGLAIVEVALLGGSGLLQVFQLSSYLNFVMLLMLAIAIAFQMPLIVLLLGWLGLATPQWLKKQRRYALLICGVVAAITTPADIISMILMLVPLYLLYELGILLIILLPASRVGVQGPLLRLPFGDRVARDNDRADSEERDANDDDSAADHDGNG